MLLRAPNGSLVDASDSHAKLLKAAGWLPVVDVAGLSVQQLSDLCRERGIKPPPRATKTKLIALVNG